ncbi:MAG TPA: MFS transporter [Candidatus Deferrimicrobiaceae bacterium]|nr:MFS transporter [Candidatus Deferrimicrobiaceae bacterium]
MLRLLPDLRYLGAGTLLNSVGMMGEVVVLGWLALELTDSPFLVGAAMGARALPLFFVGVPAGVIADRLPRQRLLIATGAGQALTAAVMGVLVLTGTVSLAQLMLLTFAGGTLRGLEHAARQSYAHDVVGGVGLVSGLAILGVAMRAGWLVGSLGVGAIIARHGSGHAYLFVAAAYLAGGLAMLPARAVTPAVPSGHDSMWQGITGFVAAVNRDRMLLVLMMLTGGAEVLGFAHQALLPSLSRDVLHTGPEGLGVLNAARSVGGILGLLASMRGFTRGGGAFFVAVLVSFGGSLIALGVAPYVVGFVGVVLLVLVANAAGALADLLAQSLLQLQVPAHLRGRAGGAWVVAIGLAPLGQIQIGALASLFGVSAALGASGLGLVALAGATALLYPRLRAL